MAKSNESQEARRRRVLELIERREREAQIAALRQIRDDPESTPAERLEAVKLLMEMERE